jgi:hypothetical protein
MSDDLSDTMKSCMRIMARKMRRGMEYCMAEPNDNTGRALEKRGYLERSPVVSYFGQYKFTDKGLAWLEANT